MFFWHALMIETSKLVDKALMLTKRRIHEIESAIKYIQLLLVLPIRHAGKAYASSKFHTLTAAPKADSGVLLS